MTENPNAVIIIKEYCIIISLDVLDYQKMYLFAISHPPFAESEN